MVIGILAGFLSTASVATIQPSTPVRMLRGSISDADYPAAARGASGRSVATLTVGTDGRVTACTISRSSGNAALDQAVCPIVQVRHRFRPATRNGQAVVGTYQLSVLWNPPQD